VFIATLGWLVHTVNIKAALQEPKPLPSSLAMSKIVFTTLILAVPVVNDGKCRRRLASALYHRRCTVSAAANTLNANNAASQKARQDLLNKANQKKPSF
jgi:hypothetical protein